MPFTNIDSTTVQARPDGDRDTLAVGHCSRSAQDTDGPPPNTLDLPMTHLIALLGDEAVTDALIADIDWPAVIRCSHRHTVTPLLYRRATALPPALQPPPELMARLHTIYLHSAVRNIQAAEELQAVLLALNAAAVPTLLLKGAHLAYLTYSDPAERVMTDLDLLIRGEDASHAREALARLGYTPFGAYQFAHDEKFERAGALTVELHWTLGRPSRPGTVTDFTAVWDRSQPATLGDVPSRVLAPADHLVYLCLHTYHHGLRVGLRRAIDVRELLRVHADQLDWAAVRALADLWGCVRPVSLVLALINDWYALPLPNEMMAWIEASGALRYVQQAQQVFLSDESDPALPDAFVRLAGSRLLSEKLRTGLSALFLPPAELAILYGISKRSPWLPWYYVRRVADFLTRWGIELFAMRQAASAVSADTSRRAALLDWVDEQR